MRLAPHRAAPRLRTIAGVQSVYWALTGLWPLVHMTSFERVTGPKAEGWLVRTVSVLIVAIAVSLGVRASRDQDLEDMRVLGITSTGGVGLVSLLAPLLARVSPVYYLDAVIDLGLAALWARARDR